jgi:membrane protein involved in colicin uptake
MAEETDPVETGGEPAEPETDWKAEARKWQKRSQENFDKAKAYDELKAQSEAELKSANEKAAAYKKEVDELHAKSELAATRAKVAEEAGVPAELVSGDDEDSMRSFAKALAAWGKPPVAPRTSNPGTFSGDAGDGKDAAKRELARKLFGSD